jgi:uncharacterized membrane protein YhiD involved in acid resistance
MFTASTVFAVLTIAGLIGMIGTRPNHRGWPALTATVLGLICFVSCLGVALGEWASNDARTHYGRR